MDETQKAIDCITSCCPTMGAFFGSVPAGFPIKLAANIRAAGPSRLFPDRYYEHVAYALELMASGRVFASSPAAVASVYLATRFEFYFRVLSGQLDARGRWLSEATRLSAKAGIAGRYPARTDLQVQKKRVSNVAAAYKVMKLRTSRPAVGIFESLDKALYPAPITMPNGAVVEDIGDRIKYLRDAGSHGEWGDISSEGIFYALLTAIVFYNQT